MEMLIICNKMTKIKITNRFAKNIKDFLKEILPNTWDATIQKKYLKLKTL